MRASGHDLVSVAVLPGLAGCGLLCWVHWRDLPQCGDPATGPRAAGCGRAAVGELLP